MQTPANIQLPERRKTFLVSWTKCLSYKSGRGQAKRGKATIATSEQNDKGDRENNCEAEPFVAIPSCFDMYLHIFIYLQNFIVSFRDSVIV